MVHGVESCTQVEKQKQNNDVKWESTVISRSLTTLVKTVSVEWRDQEPDWNFSERLLLDTITAWKSETALSSNFDIKGRLEIGLIIVQNSQINVKVAQ